MSKPHSLTHLVRKDAAAGALLVGLAIAGALFSLQRFNAANLAHAALTSSQATEKIRLDDLKFQLKAVRSSLNSYEGLVSDGFVGDLRKTELLDSIETQLTPFGDAIKSYKLEARSEFVNEGLSVLPRHKIWRHKLELTFNPLHEVEMFEIWQALDKSRKGLSAIESCTVSLKEGSGGKKGLLDAACVMYAYTIGLESEPVPGAIK